MLEGRTGQEIGGHVIPPTSCTIIRRMRDVSLETRAHKPVFEADSSIQRGLGSRAQRAARLSESLGNFQYRVQENMHTSWGRFYASCTLALNLPHPSRRRRWYGPGAYIPGVKIVPIIPSRQVSQSDASETAEGVRRLRGCREDLISISTGSEQAQ